MDKKSKLSTPSTEPLDKFAELANQFKQSWDEKDYRLRIASIPVLLVIAAIGVVLAVLPDAKWYVFAASAGLVILAAYELADYFTTPIYIRRSATMATAVLNIVLLIAIYQSDPGADWNVLSFLLSAGLLILGVDDNVLGVRLKKLDEPDYTWVIADGALALVGALAFFLLTAGSPTTFIAMFPIYLILHALHEGVWSYKSNSRA